MKRLPLFILIPLVLSLVTCLEITQYVGTKKGKLEMDYRITVQKAPTALSQR